MIRLVAGFIGLLFLAAVASIWMEKHTTEIVVIIVAIAAIIGLVAFFKHKREVPKFDDSPITPINPPWEELSGTFCCSACGGKTSFNNEINPSTACKFCGADIPEIKIMILERNQRRQDLITEDLKRQQEDRQERLDIHLRNMTEYKVRKQEQRAENAKNLIKGTAQIVVGGALYIILGLGIVAIILFVLFKRLNLI